MCNNCANYASTNRSNGIDNHTRLTGFQLLVRFSCREIIDPVYIYICIYIYIYIFIYICFFIQSNAWRVNNYMVLTMAWGSMNANKLRLTFIRHQLSKKCLWKQVGIRDCIIPNVSSRTINRKPSPEVTFLIGWLILQQLLANAKWQPHMHEIDFW